MVGFDDSEGRCEISVNSTETRSVDIMRQCRRFDRCAVAICPLNLRQGSRIRLPGEPNCTLPKYLRYRIGKEAGVPQKRSDQEGWASQERWEGLSKAEKETQMAELRPFRRIVHGSQTKWCL